MVHMRKPKPVEVDRGAVSLPEGHSVQLTTAGEGFPPLVERTRNGHVAAWVEGRSIEGRRLS